jgi:hypothetical protein
MICGCPKRMASLGGLLGLPNTHQERDNGELKTERQQQREKPWLQMMNPCGARSGCKAQDSPASACDSPAEPFKCH